MVAATPVFSASAIHYIEHIHIDPKGSTQDSRTKVQTARTRVLAEIVKAPLYRE